MKRVALFNLEQKDLKKVEVVTADLHDWVLFDLIVFGDIKHFTVIDVARAHNYIGVNSRYYSKDLHPIYNWLLLAIPRIRPNLKKCGITVTRTSNGWRVTK